MPETTPPTPPAADPIEETRRNLNALVARIYDSQKKAGNFLTDEVGEVMMEDFTDFFAELHLKVSGAYEAYKHGDHDDSSGVGVMLADITLTCLGLCKRLGHDVGKMVLDLVVVQAQEAAELERQREAEAEQGGEEDFNLGDMLADEQAEESEESEEGEGEEGR